MAIWKTVNPAVAGQLSDARRQLHHAAQLAAAFGISYLPKKADDSHTNLEWIESDEALASNSLDAHRIAIRFPDLTLLIGDRSLALRGQTMEGSAAWVREVLTRDGLEGLKYTLARHYEIPLHPVGNGAKFDAKDDDLRQLSNWYSNAAETFEEIRSRDSRASEVRCWPHHFDIATLIVFAEGKSIGVGLEPGDTYYDEPYFYVSMTPAPALTVLPDSLEGHGTWHTKEWIGAVLSASRLTSDANEQSDQVDRFVRSAIENASRLIRQDGVQSVSSV